MPALPHLPRGVHPKEIWSAIDEQGGVIVDSFLSDALLHQIRDEVMPLVAKHAPGSADAHEFWEVFHGTATKRPAA